MSTPKRSSNNRDVLKYAGLGTQIFVSLGIAVFIGVKADDWLKMLFPLLAWLLPLIVICALIYGLIKSTGKK